MSNNTRLSPLDKKHHPSVYKETKYCTNCGKKIRSTKRNICTECKKHNVSDYPEDCFNPREDMKIMGYLYND